MNGIFKREPIKFEVIETPEQKARLVEFGKTFDHHPFRMDEHPFIVVKRGEKWIGWFQFVNIPFLQTAWHTNPDIASKRDVVDGARALMQWIKTQGECLTGSPVNYQPIFLQKIGLKRTGVELSHVSA